MNVQILKINEDLDTCLYTKILNLTNLFCRDRFILENTVWVRDFSLSYHTFYLKYLSVSLCISLLNTDKIFDWLWNLGGRRGDREKRGKAFYPYFKLAIFKFILIKKNFKHKLKLLKKYSKHSFKNTVRPRYMIL